MVTVYGCEAVTVPFVTLMTKAYVPDAVGVPEIGFAALVVVPRARPVGSVPEATDQVKGPVAVPVALSVTAYGKPVVPLGSVVGVMARVEVGFETGQLLFEGAVAPQEPLHWIVPLFV